MTYASVGTSDLDGQSNASGLLSSTQLAGLAICGKSRERQD
jgi:hypothetical protein